MVQLRHVRHRCAHPHRHREPMVPRAAPPPRRHLLAGLLDGRRSDARPQAHRLDLQLAHLLALLGDARRHLHDPRVWRLEALRAPVRRARAHQLHGAAEHASHRPVGEPPPRRHLAPRDGLRHRHPDGPRACRRLRDRLARHVRSGDRLLARARAVPQASYQDDHRPGRRILEHRAHLRVHQQGPLGDARGELPAAPVAERRRHRRERPLCALPSGAAVRSQGRLVRHRAAGEGGRGGPDRLREDDLRLRALAARRAYAWRRRRRPRCAAHRRRRHQ
mmetsp:Transcript_52475/g.135944  ORF Transcript_52475/g.135944 Transcript_52475/m.135944 type:complete len:277 (-) Transcript_52475:1016-1846(-)